MAEPKNDQPPDPPAQDRHVQFLNMTKTEEDQATNAIVHLIGVLRVLFHDAQTPALALAVAAADTFAEAGTYLIMLDQRTNHNTFQSREALRDVMRMLGEYFDKQAAGVEFEATPTGEGGGEGGTKGQVH